jgi:hypothetical protein
VSSQVAPGHGQRANGVDQVVHGPGTVQVICLSHGGQQLIAPLLQALDIREFMENETDTRPGQIEVLGDATITFTLAPALQNQPIPVPDIFLAFVEFHDGPAVQNKASLCVRPSSNKKSPFTAEPCGFRLGGEPAG